MSEPRKKLSSFFRQIKLIVFKRARLKKVYSAVVPHVFFLKIYTARKILIGFAYSSILVGFRAILMLFLKILSQKIYPDENLRSEVILSRSYLRKCSIWLPRSIIINFPFFKYAVNSEPLGVRS